MKQYLSIFILSLVLSGCANTPSSAVQKQGQKQTQKQTQTQQQASQQSKNTLATHKTTNRPTEHANVSSAFKDFSPYRDVDHVAILAKAPKSIPYDVLGEVSVERVNHSGIKRQMAVVHEILQKEAFALGGDAILPCKKKGNVYVAKVIKFEKHHA